MNSFFLVYTESPQKNTNEPFKTRHRRRRRRHYKTRDGSNGSSYSSPKPFALLYFFLLAAHPPKNFFFSIGARRQKEACIEASPLIRVPWPFFRFCLSPLFSSYVDSSGVRLPDGLFCSHFAYLFVPKSRARAVTTHPQLSKVMSTLENRIIVDLCAESL